MNLPALALLGLLGAAAWLSIRRRQAQKKRRSPNLRLVANHLNDTTRSSR